MTLSGQIPMRGPDAASYPVRTSSPARAGGISRGGDMDRRGCLRVLGGAVVTTTLPPRVRAGAAAPVSVQWALHTPLAALPVRLAERLGYFAAEGVAVALAPHGSASAAALDPDAVRVHAGAFDFVLRQQLHGQPEQAFLALVRTPQLGFGWRHPAPAQGQGLAAAPVRVGVLAGDRMAPAIAALVLQGQGVAPGQVQYPTLGDVAHTQTLLASGTIDAVCVGDPMLTQLQRQGAIRLVADTRHPSDSQRLLGGPVLCACLSAPEPQVRRHGAELQSVARAVRRALRWLQTAGPSDLARHADLGGFAGDPSLFLSILMHTRGAFSPDGTLEPQAVQQVLRVLYAQPQGMDYDSLDPTRLYTTRLLPT
ncbi:hypothetical protein [uncultured Tepidimonas sp.]|uniref:hypothetical protein n=1 Tax=uncultured Tepidimonas sp. TaxID=453579 RepID=UPI002639A177|nr:hypothetical protein [uncultured Tepidimonas sp.]